jgi:hypothetical protein
MFMGIDPSYHRCPEHSKTTKREEDLSIMALTTAYNVLYVSDDDSFRTIQIPKPYNRKFYSVAEATPVVLQSMHPNVLDATDLNDPVVRTAKGRWVPLTKAIELGLVKVQEAGFNGGGGQKSP